MELSRFSEELFESLSPIMSYNLSTGDQHGNIMLLSPIAPDERSTHRLFAAVDDDKSIILIFTP